MGNGIIKKLINNSIPELRQTIRSQFICGPTDQTEQEIHNAETKYNNKSGP
jgi:hypothetical protein